MSRGTKWLAGVVSIASLMALPAAALAVFPGENGEIAFVSGRDVPNPANDQSSDVFLLDAAGDLTPIKLTTGDGQHRHPAWSPDLTRLAYARWTPPGNESIFIGGLDEGNPTLRLGALSGDILADRPAWNPAGTKIAYESEVTDGSGQMDILVTTVDEDSANLGTINLTNTNAANPPVLTEGKPVWSPDGKHIYYHTNFGAGDQDIYREKADGSQATPLGTTGVVVAAGNQFQPDLSPDGSQLCYTEGAFNNTANIFRRTVAFGTPVEISATGNNVADYNCAWSPEGDKITFVNGLLSAGQLVMKNSDDTGLITDVTTQDGGHFDGNPTWAPKRPAFCQGKPALIVGTDGRDTLRGTSAKDVMQGHIHNDTISGRRGGDVICGSKGNDVLRGGPDNDKLFGGAGKDRIIGGGGRDRLVGGGDKDLLRGGGGRDKCSGGPGKDKEKSCER